MACWKVSPDKFYKKFYISKSILTQINYSLISAKNELFHLCAEVEETGADSPTIERVISMLLEDVLSEGVSDTVESSPERLRRTLRSTKDSPMPRRRALRAHHLPYNNYHRPRRLMQPRLEDDEEKSNLMDFLSVTGGYDGEMIFARFELDVSKQFVTSFDELIQKPLDLLNEIDFLKNILPSSGTDKSPVSLDTNVSLAANAHVGVLGAYEKTCEQICTSELFLTNLLLSCSKTQLGLR